MEDAAYIEAFHDKLVKLLLSNNGNIPNMDAVIHAARTLAACSRLEIFI